MKAAEGARKRRRSMHAHDEAGGHGGQERWLVSYADMITLLFCLFLVLYAMSRVNQQKFSQLSRSLSKALEKNPDDPALEPMTAATLANQAPPPTSEEAKAAEKRRQAEIMKEISHRLGDLAVANGWRNKVHVHEEESGLVVTLLTDSLLFETGDAEIRAQAVPMIQGLAKAVKPFPNLIRVEGHTDNVPLRGGPYKTNWGLSTMRATNVAEVIIKGGHVDAHRLSVLGYGDTRQRVPNTSDANRQKNRRVEIIILKGRSSWGDQN